MKMQDELPCFASSLSEMTIVHSKMAPIQVMHIICVIALKSLCYCSVHVDESSINKDSMASSYIHQIHETSRRANYQRLNQDVSVQ